MHSFHAIAIPTEVAAQVRKTGKSPIYGFPAHREVAAGRAPCRHCLNLIELGREELLLFTYDPFRELVHVARAWRASFHVIEYGASARGLQRRSGILLSN